VSEPIWQPSARRIAESNLQRFIATHRARLARSDYAALYDWSIAEPAEFWAAVWKFCRIQSTTDYESVVQDFERMPGARWFEGATLNFAANLLRPEHTGMQVRPTSPFKGHGAPQ
jgi:acetoacetyl-CoA synthetase